MFIKKKVIGIASKEKKYTVSSGLQIQFLAWILFLLNQCNLKSVSFGTKTNECDESELNITYFLAIACRL